MTPLLVGPDEVFPNVGSRKRQVLRMHVMHLLHITETLWGVGRS